MVSERTSLTTTVSSSTGGGDLLPPLCSVEAAVFGRGELVLVLMQQPMAAVEWWRKMKVECGVVGKGC